MVKTSDKIALGRYQNATLLRVVTRDTAIHLELLVDGKKEEVHPAALINMLLDPMPRCNASDITIQMNCGPAAVSFTSILDPDYDTLTVTYELKHARLAELRMSPPGHYTFVVKSR